MKQTQKGFSLVELMVALVLGLIITAAAVQLFVTNHRTFQLQRLTSQIQEDGQLFVRFLVQDLRKTGIVLDEVSAPGDVGIVQTPYTANGRTLPASANGANYDRLTLAYHANVGDQDCEGNQLSTDPGMIVNTYYVDEDAESLFCEGSLDGGTTGVEILTGVEGFEVVYGVDTTENGFPRVTRYVDASNIGASGGAVVSVRFSLLLSRESQVLPQADGSKTFYLLQKDITENADRAVRRQFMTTVQLRNYDWDGV